MNDREVAQLLRSYAKRLRDIRFHGTARYLEELDGLASEISNKAESILTPRSFSPEDPGHFFPGDRQIGRRRITVMVRRSRLAAA
jgi:hypothetical protein